MSQPPAPSPSRAIALLSLAAGAAAVLWGLIKGFIIGAPSSGGLVVSAGVPLIVGGILVKFGAALMERD